MGTLVHGVSLKVTNQTANGLREEKMEEGREGGEGRANITLHLARV